MASASRSKSPWSARACDLLLVSFAVWTLACNAVVLVGGGLRLAAVVFVVLAVLAGGLAWRLRASAVEAGEAKDAGGWPRASTRLAWIGAPALGAAWGLAAVQGAERATIPLWCATVAFLGLALFLELRAPATASAAPARSRAREGLAWLLAIGAALLPLFAHKPSPDDTYYINVAVAAADDPGAPVLRDDTLHGVPGAPIMHAAYRVNSYELLAGLAAWLTPLTATEATHWLLPSLFGFFLVLAHARLLRLLVPRRWTEVLVVTLAILLLVGETNQFHGNFAFLRLTQGKSALLSVFLPLTVFWALSFARRPRPGAWLLLAAAQVAAIGASSTGLWCAPIVLVLALLGGLRARPARTFLVGLAASAYVVVAGLVVYARSLTESDHAEVVEGVRLVTNTAEPIVDSAKLVRAAWDVVLGTGAVSALGLLAVLGAWSTVRDSRARRALLALSLGTLVFLLDPLGAVPVARYVTGDSTYWRALWVLPLPLLMALLLTAPLRLAAGGARVAGVAVTLLATGLFLWRAPAVHGLSADNEVRWEPLILNAPPQAWEPARALVQSVEPGAHVLAPKHVAAWIPTFHQAPYSLVTREHYLYLIRDHLPEGELELRLALCDLVGGTPPSSPGNADGEALLRRGIQRFGLRAVAFLHTGRTAPVVRRVLQATGFRPTGKNSRYETWVRGGR